MFYKYNIGILYPLKIFPRVYFRRKKKEFNITKKKHKFIQKSKREFKYKN